MAIGKASDFVIYHDEFFGGFQESIDQNVNAFNAASRNAIRIVPRSSLGDYQKESFLKDISGLVSRRDTTSVAAATDLAMTQGEEVRVKINRKIGPVAQTLDAWRKIGLGGSELSLRFGQMAGAKVAQDYVNTSIKALIAAVTQNSAMSIAATGADLTQSNLADLLAKYGDMSGDVVAYVMHSKPYYDLVKDQLAASSELFSIGALVVQSGQVPTLNRPVIITDAPDLVVAGTTTTYLTLALTENAVQVIESEQREVVSDTVTGLDNIVGRVQGEYAYNLGLRGYTWDVTNGGANPTDGAVGTSTNWDQVATSDKHTAAAMVTTT